MRQTLKHIYKEALREFPEEQSRFADGFKIVEPTTDRSFYFKPNPGENGTESWELTK